MKSNYENTALVQKKQLDEISNKLTELTEYTDELDLSNRASSDLLNSLESEVGLLLESLELGSQDYKNLDPHPIVELSSEESEAIKEKYKISPIEFISTEEVSSWEEYSSKVDNYIRDNDIDINKDPFETLLTPSQAREIENRIKKDFTLKNANCDKYDYMIAGTCGVIGGLIDVLFVGAPWDSKLGSTVDSSVNKATEKFAELLGWDREKATKKGSNLTSSAVAFLEKKYKINYDHATTASTGGAVKNLSMKNHHLKSLGHSPDLIGLFFSILNQFTNTSSFISNGQIITIDTDTFELKGGNIVSKVFCGFANWFGHIMSDMAGSSGTIGQGRRGTGVPIPFYNLLQMINVGEFGEHKQTFATITTKVFESGYDFRHGLTMAIPVLITELLVRFMWFVKSHYYHNNNWKDSIPNGNSPELRRMLLIGHGTLCLVDGVDAAIRSGGDIVTFLSRTNLIGWVRFGQLGLKELSAWYNAGHIDTEAINDYMGREYKRMLSEIS